MILVAGGGGRLGRELVTLLHARGERPRVLSRNPVRAAAALGPQVQVAQGDVREPATLPVALKGVEVVVSAVTGFGPGGAGTKAVDEEGNANLISAAEAAGARHFVLVSVEEAAPDHPMELMRRKYAAEQRLRRGSMTWTIVRPTAFAELWTGIIGGPLRTGAKATVFGSGDNPVNFVATGDVARIVEHAIFDASLNGATVGVGGPENVSLNQLVAMIAEAGDLKPRARHVPVSVLRIAGAAMKPFRPDLAGMMEAAVSMAERDMRFDVGELTARFPEHRPTTLKEVVEGYADGGTEVQALARRRSMTPATSSNDDSGHAV